MNKKTKNVLLDIMGREKQNLKSQSKNSKEKTVEIYGSTTSVRDIAISDIKNCHSWKLRDDLLEWKNSDFTIYFIQQFRKNISEDWSGDRVAMILFLGRVIDRIAEILGFCDNIVLKDYMDFFIQGWAKYYWKKKGNFTPWYLKDNLPIKDFASKYNYEKSFNKFILSKQKNESEILLQEQRKISKERIEQFYLAGGESLVLEYGLLVPLNWLVICKNYSIEQSNLHIMGAFGSLHSNGNWESSISKTELLNPYPESFIIKNCDTIFKKLNIEIDLKLMFSQENWCNL